MPVWMTQSSCDFPGGQTAIFHIAFIRTAIFFEAPIFYGSYILRNGLEKSDKAGAAAASPALRRTASSYVWEAARSSERLRAQEEKPGKEVSLSASFLDPTRNREAWEASSG